MADANNKVVDLSGLGGYVHVDGIGTSDLFTHDGIFKMLPLRFKPTLSEGERSKGELMLLASLAADATEDTADSVNGGRKIIRNIMCGGKDKNGEPMIRQLGELLESAGWTVEQIREIAKNGSTDGEKLAVYVQNACAAGVYAEVSARSYDGKMMSEITRFVSAADYEAAKKNGAYRKPHNAGAGATLGAAAKAAIGGLGLGVAQPGLGAPVASLPAQPVNGLAVGKRQPAL